jgi:hypothetical protein
LTLFAIRSHLNRDERQDKQINNELLNHHQADSYRITTYYLQLSTYYLQLITFNLLLKTYYLKLITYNFQLKHEKSRNKTHYRT